MRANAILFWILAGFFGLSAGVYAFWTWIDDSEPHMEPAGTVALTLTAVLAAFIAFYLGRVHSAQGAELPEDRLDANIDDGDAELGFFSPWSWWPIMLAAGLALIFLGLAIGLWIALIGGAFTFVSLMGWQYEYYRGNFGR